MHYILIVNYMEERFKVRLDGSSKLKASDLVSGIYSGLSLKSRLVEISVYVPSRSSFINLLDPFFKGMDDIGSTLGRRIICEISEPSSNDCSDNLKMIEGRIFNVDGVGFQISGKRLIVREISNNQVNATGLNIWDGSILLARYLEYNTDLIFGKTVLELGCGPGLCGISAAIIGATEVVMTDLKYSLQLAHENIRLNLDSIQGSGCKRIDVQECDWFCPPSIETLMFTSTYPQTILIADCIWVEELVDPLMATIGKFSHKRSNVLMAYQRRGKAAHDRFFDGLNRIFSNIQDVGCEFIQEEGISEKFSIFLCNI